MLYHYKIPVIDTNKTVYGILLNFKWDDDEVRFVLDQHI